MLVMQTMATQIARLKAANTQKRRRLLSEDSGSASEPEAGCDTESATRVRARTSLAFLGRPGDAVCGTGGRYIARGRGQTFGRGFWRLAVDKTFDLTDYSNLANFQDTRTP